MKNTRNYKHEVIPNTGLGVFFLVILLCGCGVWQTQDADIESESELVEESYIGETVYVPSHVDMTSFFEGSDTVQLNLDYGKVYGLKSSYTEEGGHACEMIVYDVLTGEVSNIVLEEGTNHAYPRLYRIQKDGNITLIVGEKQGGLALLTYDEKGAFISNVSLIFPDDLSKRLESIYISDMIQDFDGNMAIATENRIIVVHEDGTLNFEIKDAGLGLNLHLSENGEICYPLNSGFDSKLYYVDMEGLGIGESYRIEMGYGMRTETAISISDEMIYTYMNTDGIMEYGLESKEGTFMMKWLDIDCMKDDVYDMNILNDKQLFLLEKDPDTGATLEGILLTKTPIDEVPQKEQLTIAVTQASSELKEQVADYNKEQTEYRIQIEEYVDVTKLFPGMDYLEREAIFEEATENLMIDLVGSNPPDMIGGVGGTQGFDIATLADKGILEDLTPYLEASGYSEEDFVTSIYEANKVDGKVYYIPQLFSIITVFANAEYVGDEMGWDLTEALEVLENLPDGVYYDGTPTKSGVFYQLFWYAIEEFVDFESGTCDFDSDLFRKVLEVASSYPDKVESDISSASDAFLLNEGITITYGGSVRNLMNLSEVLAVFGDTPVTAIGKIGVIGNGTIYNSGMEGIVMLSESEHKEHIAEFLLSNIAIDETYDFYIGDGFPILQEQFEEVLEVQTDQDHFEYESVVNPYCSDGGERIVIDNRIMRGWDDFGVECDIPSEREVNMLLALLEGLEESMDNRTRDIAELVVEDVKPYFVGQKTVDEVIKIIQNRVSLYLAEQG